MVSVEHEPRSGRVPNPTYIAVAILRSVFAALTAAALVASLEAWCTSRSSLLRTHGCAGARTAGHPLSTPENPRAAMGTRP
jgi:hypothetical protein